MARSRSDSSQTVTAARSAAARSAAARSAAADLLSSSPPPFDYQSDQHCAKTSASRSARRRCLITSQINTAPKHRQGPKFLIDLSQSGIGADAAAIRLSKLCDDEKIEGFFLVSDGFLREIKK